MEYRKQTPEEGQERIGHTKWMVNHSKKEDLDKLMGHGAERTASVPDLLLPRLGEKNMSVEVMSELAGFNRATGYKIINGKQRAERDMLLRIAFVLEFTYEETAQLLKSGLRSALTSDFKAGRGHYLRTGKPAVPGRDGCGAGGVRTAPAGADKMKRVYFQTWMYGCLFTLSR